METSGENLSITSLAVWRRAAAGIVGATVVLAIAAGLTLRQEFRHHRALVLREGSYVVELEREFLSRELGALHSDLRFLTQQPILERFVAGDNDVLPALEREYAGFVRSKPLYDQIRLLDATGRELVRVNRRGEEVQVAEQASLQSKGARYYFRQAIGLGAGEIFVSPLDLNVEAGQIERPPKPVIRLATPVGGRSAERRGVLVLNYAGARLLGKLREIAEASQGDVMLVDPAGEYLQAPDGSREWGWLLGHSASFRGDHPEAWQQMRAAKRTQLQIGGDLYTTERVPLAEDDVTAGSAVLIVSRIPLGDPLDLLAGAGRYGLLFGAFVAIVALAFYWARTSVARRLQDRRIAESEARLRVLSSSLLAAQEEERRSLSRLLHDELGQRVTAIALDLKAALRRQVDADTQPVLRRAVHETEGVLSSLHEIASRVRPSVLDDLGLADAIDSYVSEYEERTGVKVAVDVQLPPEGLSVAVAENLYRILQEGLANVWAHAGVEVARVALHAGASELELVIEDEGCGFDAATVQSTNRLGILGMRERVELLGGEFDLETAPERGTKIHVRLPLRSD